MIVVTSSYGKILTRQKARRRALTAYWAFAGLFAILLGLGEAGILSHKSGPLVGAAGGAGAAIVIFVFTRMAFGILVEFESPRLKPRTPFALLNGFLDGLLGVVNHDHELLSLDERDLYLRNRVHYDAFRFMRSVALCVGIFFCFLPWAGLAYRSWMTAPVAFLAIFALMFLPQTLVLWREPDIANSDMESQNAS
jgi:hypothetical protein